MSAGTPESSWPSWLPEGRRTWAIALVALAAYLNTIPNDFVWDDLHLIVQNERLASFENAFRAFGAPANESGLRHSYYRPLDVLTFTVDRALFGLQPAGYHVENAAIHAGAAACVFRVGLALFGAPGAAFLAGLLFAVHPVNTEAVTFVSMRSYSLSTLLMLASLLLLLASRRRGLAAYFGSLVCCAGALLVHEQALVLPLLAVLADAADLRRNGPPTREAWIRALATRWLPFGGVAAVYLIFRHAAVGPLSVPMASGAVALPLRLFTMARVIWVDLQLLALPINQHMVWEITPSVSFADPKGLAAVLGLTALAAGAYRLRRFAFPMTFGALWLAISLTPYSQVIPLYDWTCERWLYLASAGFCVAAGHGAAWLAAKGGGKEARFVIATGLAVLMALTVKRNGDWRDGIRLYQQTLHYTQDAPVVWGNLGYECRRAGLLPESERAYRRAIALDPRAVSGVERLTAYERAWRSQTDYADLHANLGDVLRGMGRLPDAVAELSKALAITPGHGAALNNLGLTYDDMGKLDEARAAFEEAIRRNPSFPAAHSNLGNHYYRHGDLAHAAAEYEAAIRASPAFADAHNNLGSVYFRMGRIDDAERELTRALALKPDLAQAAQNLQAVRGARLAPRSPSPSLPPPGGG